MAVFRLRYVQEFTDRHGHKRRYFRKGDIRKTLTGIPGSAEFMAAYQQALAESESTRRERKSRAREGTIARAVDHIYDHPDWAALKPSTRRAEQNLLERIRKAHGHRPIASLDRATIVRIVGAFQTPGAANNMLRAFKKILKYAIAAGMRQDDPSSGISPTRYTKEHHKTWAEADVAKFLASYGPGTRERLAMLLMLCTSQRRSDIVLMGRQHVTAGVIHIRQQKTGVELDIPLHPDLRAEIANHKAAHMTYLVTQHGKPFSAAGFGNWFREVCDKAGLPDISAHGLRRACLTRLAEAGCSARQIMAISGHKTLSEVQKYVDGADQKKMAAVAMSMLGDVTGTKTVNPKVKG